MLRVKSFCGDIVLLYHASEQFITHIIVCVNLYIFNC